MHADMARQDRGRLLALELFDNMKEVKKWNIRASSVNRHKNKPYPENSFVPRLSADLRGFLENLITIPLFSSAMWNWKSTGNPLLGITLKGI